MKTVSAGIVALVMFNAIHAGEPEPGKLDPANAKDRAVLFDLVKQSSNGKSNRSAKILADAGYMDDLLEILKTTTSYNTMQAIAGTRDERTIAIFEARLRHDPGNRYLVGALAYVQSPKAAPILVQLLQRHPDAENPDEMDIVGCILNALVFNRCQDAIPLLRERFTACKPSPGNDRKANYALTLLALGDPVGVSWLSNKLKEARTGNVAYSWTAERLDTLCGWMRRDINIVKIQDENIAAPLLPELVHAAATKQCSFSEESRQILSMLTRHDFAVGDPKWQQWYANQKDNHPIYSTPLDRTAQLCAATFRADLASAGKKHTQLKWMHSFLGKAQNGYGSHNDFLWKLESRPELHAAVFAPENKGLQSFEKRKELGITFTVALTSRTHVPAQPIFVREFPALNITVFLISPTKDDDVKKRLRQLAEQACVPLADYQSFWLARTKKGS